MAVAKIAKAEFYIHKSDVDGVLSALQNTGSFEVIPFSSEDGSEGPVITHPDFSRVDFLLGETRFLLRFLEPHFIDPVSGMARLWGRKRSFRSGRPGSCFRQIFLPLPKRPRTRGRLMEIRSESSQLDHRIAPSLLNDIPTRLNFSPRHGTRPGVSRDPCLQFRWNPGTGSGIPFGTMGDV